MGRRGELRAEDDVERQILLELDGLGSQGRLRAAKVLHVSRDVIDHMYAAPAGGKRRPMRLQEARVLARLVGRDLTLEPLPPSAPRETGLDLVEARMDARARKAAKTAPTRRARPKRERRAG